jgi:antitoxin PrlF
MKTCVSKISAKFRTTIPKAVREYLNLRPGDLLRYKLERNGTSIKLITDQAFADPFATFTEWASEADERAFNSL